MPANSSNPELPASTRTNEPSTQSGEGGEIRELEAEKSKAVKTFAFDVSAGSTVRAEDAELPLPAIPKPKFIGIAPETNNRGVYVNDSTTAQEETVAEEVIPTAIELDSVEPLPQVVNQVPTKSQRPRFVGGNFLGRISAWWTTSLAVHLMLLFALAFSTIVVLQEEEPLELVANPIVFEVPEEFEDLEIDPVEELEELSDTLLDEPLELEAIEIEEVLPEPPTTSPTETNPPADDPTLKKEALSVDVANHSDAPGQLFSEESSALTEIGGGTVAATASFYGTEVKARRILYMLDNSGGMRHGGKFESLVQELLKSVAALKSKQKYYVVFYSDTVYPLFYPQSIRKFVSASNRNQKQLKRWLDSVELCTGNAIDEALAAAEVIRPDAVFLLTDGNLFTTEKKKALLLNRSGRKYSIHTFGLGVNEGTKTAAGLQEVAAANEGTYRAIEITDAMKELESKKERPYHNKRPGLIWGLKVGSR